MKNYQIFAAFILFNIFFVTPTMGIEQTRVKKEDSKMLNEILVGVLAHDVGGLWSGSKKEAGADFNTEIILKYPNIPLLLGSVYSNIGLSVNNMGNTSNIYLGLLWDRKLLFGTFLNLGIGVAVHDGELETDNEEKKELGSRFLFRIPVEFGYMINKHHRLSILFAHLSNAYIAYPNEGLDVIGIRYGYKF